MPNLLTQLGDFDAVHVGERLVLTSHRPAKSIAGSAAASMNGPRRRKHDLAVGHPQRASFLRLPHHMQDAVRGRDIKITINFAAPIMGVTRHGIPNAAGFKLRKTEHELATFDAVFVDMLENGALVALVIATKFHTSGISASGVRRGIGSMRRITDKIENGWINSLGTGKGNLLTAAANVKAVVGAKLIVNTINGNHPRTPKIEDTHFAALTEEISLEYVIVTKHKWDTVRDGTADDGAVEIGMNQSDFTRIKKLFDEKRRAEFFRIKNGSFAGRRRES